MNFTRGQRKSDHSMKCQLQAIWFTHQVNIQNRQIPGASVLLIASTSSYFEACTKPHNCMNDTNQLTCSKSYTKHISQVAGQTKVGEVCKEREGEKLCVHLYFLHFKVLRICKARIPIRFRDWTWTIQSSSRCHKFRRG